jgi:hypothetical protein
MLDGVDPDTIGKVLQTVNKNKIGKGISKKTNMIFFE